MNSLFICATPLQSLIASRIIEMKHISRERCVMFFYSTVNDSKIVAYYEKLRGRCGQSRFYHCEKRFSNRMMDARRFFNSITYDDVYIASVNSVYVQLALSLGRHRRIFTFDDGTANISPSSIYNSRHGMSLRKTIASRIFGNRYSIDRIKAETNEHYTIYPGVRNNMSDKPVPVTIFSSSGGTTGHGHCSIILGTVFKEAFGTANAPLVVAKLVRFSQTLGENSFYIPHPRETAIQDIGVQTLISDKIAEEVIADIGKDFSNIDLYGFCSTAQINVLSMPNLNNHFFATAAEKPSSRDMRAVAREMGIVTTSTIDLETY